MATDDRLTLRTFYLMLEVLKRMDELEYVEMLKGRRAPEPDLLELPPFPKTRPLDDKPYYVRFTQRRKKGR